MLAWRRDGPKQRLGSKSAALLPSSATANASKVTCRDIRAGCCSHISSSTATARSSATKSRRLYGESPTPPRSMPASTPSSPSYAGSSAPLPSKDGGLFPALPARADLGRPRSRLGSDPPRRVRVAQQDWRRAWGPAQVALFVAERGFLPGEDAGWVGETRNQLSVLHLRALEAYAATELGIGSQSSPVL